MHILTSSADNITPPIASCLGDLLTLTIIGLISSFLIRFMNTVLPVTLLVICILGAVFAITLTVRNEYVRSLVTLGWIPLFGAMIISSGTGMVLDSFVNRYEGFGLLSIVIGGMCKHSPFLLSSH